MKRFVQNRSGQIRVWPAFDAGNPQHFGWLKRKLQRAERYRRHYARRPPRLKSAEPRHLQSRKPAFSVYMTRPRIMARHGITGAPIIGTLEEWQK